MDVGVERWPTGCYGQQISHDNDDEQNVDASAQITKDLTYEQRFSRVYEFIQNEISAVYNLISSTAFSLDRVDSRRLFVGRYVA